MNGLEPIRLARESAPGAGLEWIAALPWWTWPLGALALGLVVAGLASLAYALGLAWGDPADRAFRRLAVSMRLYPSHRRTVRRLARGAGAPPVALLLSRAAFDEAVRRDGADAGDAGAVARRVFA